VISSYDADPNVPGGSLPIPAAQYVRMSTEHQKYSTENQATAIHEYAQKHGMTIVRTYADEGKSGLNIDGRKALKSLIEDVQSGCAGFRVIIVYDVSRWGRFQDADESAYYEYICRRAGSRVVYCAEPFDNDGSPIATIVKSVKRAMAGEYSRELSAKVFIGQCRLVELGYRQGGKAGYGLRRLLLDESGTHKKLLIRGEQKSLQTDRVVLTPGPEEEVATVRRIYRLFVESGKPEREIAALLNCEGSRNDMGRDWTRGTVHEVLTNEKYVGNNVYNRVSFKLKKKRVVNSPDMWVRADAAFAAIVEKSLFAQARSIIEERSHFLSNDQMLALLRSLLEKQGGLSGLIIDERDDMPSSSTYRGRFGSLLRAYELIGFRPRRDYRYIEINRALRRLHPEVVAGVVHSLVGAGGTVARDASTDLLTVNDEFTVSLIIARCRQTPSGAYRWHLRLDTSLKADITVAIRMNAQNVLPLDYYLLPRIDMEAERIQFAEDNGLSLDAYRFDTLEILYGFAARTLLREVA
jgi:DNA invertase Pin-like site-specific DNA recombinase